MKHFIVVTLMGRDRPGLVNTIAHTIKEHQGNIRLQRSVKMIGEFSLITLFSVETETAEIDSILTAFNNLGTNDLFVHAKKAFIGTNEYAPGTNIWSLEVTGADQMGIIDDITMLLCKKDINIEEMDYDVKKAPMSGVPLFEMKAKLAIPQHLELEAFKQELQDHEHQFAINISLNSESES